MLTSSDIEVDDPPRARGAGGRRKEEPEKISKRSRADKGVAATSQRGRVATRRSKQQGRKAGSRSRRVGSRSVSTSRRRPPKGHTQAGGRGGLRPVLEGRGGSAGRDSDGAEAATLRARLDKERRNWTDEKKRLVAMLQARDKAGRALKGKVESLRGKLQGVR